MTLTRFPNGVSSFGMPLIGSGPVFTTGKVFFVHKGGSDDNIGDNPDFPLATIDKAVGKCTANKGDYIIVMPGHTENIVAAAGLDLDVAGITVLGIGSGDSRPAVSLITATTADIDVDADDITVKNIIFKAGIDALAVIFDINKKQFTLEDCEFREGSAIQWLTAIEIGGVANEADRATIRRCKFVSYTLGANNAIKLAAVSDEVTIEDCVIDGDFADAGIHNPTALVCTNLRLLRNVVRNRQTGDHAIELVSACTGEAVGNMLFTDTPGVVFDPGSLFCADNREQYKIDSPDFSSPAGLSSDGWIHVAKAAATLPATTTQTIFTVAGGRVLVKLLLGEVTTVIQAQITNLKATSAPTVGTAVDLAANLDINAKEAGTLLLVEGDGTALVGANAGAALNGVGKGEYIVPVGVIRIETGATSTGATKWDIWYRPLDVGARIS